MTRYTVEVLEVVERLVAYSVEAESADDAQAQAEYGIAEDKTELPWHGRFDAVTSRRAIGVDLED